MLQNPWQINLLGGFAIKQRARESSLPLTNQMALLLAMLADRLGRPQQRADLIEGLWPDVDTEVGRNRFRVLLAEIRRLLEPMGTPSGSVLSSDRSVTTLSSSACRVDASEFLRHIQKANQSTVAKERIEHYKAADDLYLGDFMSGRQGEWIEGRRSHYARLQALAQFRFSALLEEAGDLPGAMLQIARSIEADPLREAPRRRALRLMVVAGDVGSALSEYEEYQKLLKRMVGLAPTAEFQDWVKKLRAWVGAKRAGGTENPVAASIMANQETTATEPERQFLPPSLSTFIGRSADIAELSDLLPLYRWITLTGPGGIGKTRLAIETARANAHLFGGGLIYVPGSDSPGSSSLIETILRQVQIEPSSEPLETLRQYLVQPVESGRSACLLVLDGIDQLSSDTNQVVRKLLTEVPNATVLATARKKRGASGEHEYAVGPLSVPDSQTQWDQLLSNASIQLFAERAEAASPRFAITRTNAADVIALCTRLEGIPLAIELAAAQAGKVPPTEILRKLGDDGSLDAPKNWREPRHRSLQASLAFSLDALEPRERQLFCSLCVFRGGFDAASASIVAGAASNDLAKLAEHSLLVRASDLEHRRYTMLDMIREFGWSKLSVFERNAVQDRHATYFHQFAADTENLHFSSGMQQPLKLRLDAGNLCLAAEWMLKKGDADAAVKLVVAVCGGGIHSGFQREGLDLIARVREGLSLSELQIARLDAAEGGLACTLDDAKTARELIGRALPVMEAHGLTRHAAGARWGLAYAAYLSGDFEHCISYAQQIEPGVGDYHVRNVAYRRTLLGMAYCELGMLEEATSELQAALRNWRDLGDLLIVNFCRLSLTRVTWKSGQLAEAWAEYHSAAAEFDAVGDPRGLAYAIEGLGRVSAGIGLYSRAAHLLGAAQRLRESIGLRRDFGDNQAFEEASALTRNGLGGDFESEWQAGYGVAPTRVAKWVADIPEPQESPAPLARDA